MPSQAEVKWSQLKVGLIVLVSLALLSTLLFLISSATGLSVFSHELTVSTYFTNSQGLKPGAPVDLEGVGVGEVKTIGIVTDAAHRLSPVRVVLKLNPKFGPSLHTDTTAALSTVGVLGDTVVDLDSKTASGPALGDGAVLRSTEAPTIADVVKSSQGTIQSVNVVLGQLHDVMAGLQKGQGSVGQPPTDDTLYNNLNATLNNANLLLNGINAGQGSLGMLVKDPTFANKLNSTVTRLDTLLTGINNGQGTLGKLATDKAAYDNLNTLLVESTNLVTTIRQDPKKYLTIHMKIF